jgi:hypothetical protein
MSDKTGNGAIGGLEKARVGAACAAFVALRWPLAALTGREPDGWRRAVGLGLRSDGTKFGLSAFGLDLFSDLPKSGRGVLTRERAEAHFAKRWASFVAGEPEAGGVLRHGTYHVERLPGRAEVVISRFSSVGDLESIEPAGTEGEDALAPRPDFRIVVDAFSVAHRATRELPERERPQAILSAVEAVAAGVTGGTADAARRLARTISAACQVSFEAMPESTERFFPPDFRLRRPAGYGVLNVVARLSKDFCGVDVWLQIHHAATDGAPMQEMLARLEKAWGFAHPARFPKCDPARKPRLISVQPSPRDRPISEVVDFIDFGPLLQWREEMNTRYRGRIGGDAPVVCALMWQLARQAEFAGRKFSTAVDVPSTARHARAVAMVGIRPGDYSADGEGFADFSRDYLSLLDKARARTTPGWRLVRQLALLSPGLAAKALIVDASRGRRIFGTVGLSMLKDARVFSAPMEDAGWYEGFMAIGNARLPDCGGGTVAAITARGEAETVRHYPGSIRRAIKACVRRPQS